MVRWSSCTLCLLAALCLEACAQSAHKEPFIKAKTGTFQSPTGAGGLSKVANSARGVHCMDLTTAFKGLVQSGKLLSVYTGTMDLGTLTAASCPEFRSQADADTVASFYLSSKPNLYEPYLQSQQLLSSSLIGGFSQVTSQDKCSAVKFADANFNIVCSTPTSVTLQNTDGSNEIRKYEMDASGLKISVFEQVQGVAVCGGGAAQNFVSETIYEIVPANGLSTVKIQDTFAALLAGHVENPSGDLMNVKAKVGAKATDIRISLADFGFANEQIISGKTRNLTCATSSTTPAKP